MYMLSLKWYSVSIMYVLSFYKIVFHTNNKCLLVTEFLKFCFLSSIYRQLWVKNLKMRWLRDEKNKDVKEVFVYVYRMY